MEEQTLLLLSALGFGVLIFVGVGISFMFIGRWLLGKEKALVIKWNLFWTGFLTILVITLIATGEIIALLFWSAFLVYNLHKIKEKLSTHKNNTQENK